MTRRAQPSAAARNPLSGRILAVGLGLPRCLVGLKITISIAAMVAVSLPVGAQSPDVFSFVKKSCVACHNAAVKSGDLDLAALQTSGTFEHEREIWEKIVEKLKLGQMPPPGAPPPPAEITAKV